MRTTGPASHALASEPRGRDTHGGVGRRALGKELDPVVSGARFEKAPARKCTISVLARLRASSRRRAGSQEQGRNAAMRQESPVPCSPSHSTCTRQKGADTHVGDDPTLPKRLAERKQAPDRPLGSSVPREPLVHKAALDEQSHARNLNKRRAVRCCYACTRKSTEQDVHFDVEYAADQMVWGAQIENPRRKFRC